VEGKGGYYMEALPVVAGYYGGFDDVDGPGG